MHRNNQRLILAASSLLLAACGPSDDTLSALGRSQKIQESAPVKASSAAVINAPTHKVWNILTNVANWPRWQPDVSSVSIARAPRTGVPFTWISDDTTIHSRMVLFSPFTSVAWIGHASLARAVHVFTLTALDSNRTRVESKESMDGPMLSRFYSSAELRASEDKLLKNLKAASESSPASSGAEN